MKKIGLTGRYSDSKPKAMNLSGSKNDYKQFVDLIKGKDSIELALKIPEMPPTPYCGYINTINIEISKSKLRIKGSNLSLIVSGTKDSIELFINNIQSLMTYKARKDTKPRPHIHVEYYSGSDFIESDSEPLVLTLDCR